MTSLRQITLGLPLMLACCMALAPECFGQHKAYIPQFSAPVQHYAIIDISGALTDQKNQDGTAATSVVSSMALNDENKAAFGFAAGKDTTILKRPFGNYTTYTWENGTPSFCDAFGLYEVVDHTHHEGSADETYDISYTGHGVALANGATISSSYTKRYTFDFLHPGVDLTDQFAYESSLVSSPSPNWLQSPFLTGYPELLLPSRIRRDVWTFALSENGCAVGAADVKVKGVAGNEVGIGFLLDADHKATIFDPATDYSGVTPSLSASNMTLVRADIGEPSYVNKNGWVTGYDNHYSAGHLWTGALPLVEFGEDIPLGLNEQGQVILWRRTATPDIYVSGYLWENNAITALADKLPFWMAWQYFSIQPSALSNQVKPAVAGQPTPTGFDKTIRILTDTAGVDVGTQQKTVWTRDKDADKWNFANVALPEGTAITYWKSINSSGVIAAIGNGGHALLLLPMDTAPDVLKANGNFDEGRLDAQSGYALRDCDDEDLKADRDSYHNSAIKSGKIVTEDLHQNFFGPRPDTFPESWVDSATITIERLRENDPDTNRPETGEIRLYAIENLGRSDEQFWPIPLTEPDPQHPGTTRPKNLVNVLYGQNPQIPKGPDVQYWMEGINSGPITLEFKYTKGSFTFNHKQKFKVVTEQSKEKWQQEARNEILLETLGQIDINTYQIVGDPIDLLNTKYFVSNRDNALAVYRHYEKIYMVGQQKYLWAGLAKLAGAPVYAGLSDAQWGRMGMYVNPVGLISGAILQNIQTILIQANINIYLDLAWQFAAYRCSGIDALRFVNTQNDLLFDYSAWQKINDGIFENDTVKISDGNVKLLRREQEVILDKTYKDLDRIGFRFVSWLISILTKNPVPGGPDFSHLYERKMLSDFARRWDWITRDGDGMWPLWLASPISTRQGWVKIPMRTRAEGYTRVPLAPIW